MTSPNEAPNQAMGGITRVRRIAITVTVMMASSMYTLDWTIAAVALPHMQGTFSVTQDQISWVLTSYIVISAIALPTTAWLSERIGWRQLYLVAITGFTLFSALCGIADSLAAEIAYRLAQGAFGAFLIPYHNPFCWTIIPAPNTPRPWPCGAWASCWRPSLAPRSAAG